MKSIYLLTLLAFITITTHAQQQGINYQAVARNANGEPMVNTLVAVRFSILNGSATGPVVYAERDTATTNSFGLFTVIIGNGQVLTGSMAGINWASASKYMEVDLDITGGSNYTNMGVTQLLSVPYAYYADSAGNTGATGANSYTGLKHHYAYITSNATWTNMATDTADILILTPAIPSVGSINGMLHNGGDEVIIVNNSGYNWNIYQMQPVQAPAVQIYIPGTGEGGSYTLTQGQSVRLFYEPVSNQWWVLKP